MSDEQQGNNGQQSPTGAGAQQVNLDDLTRTNVSGVIEGLLAELDSFSTKKQEADKVVADAVAARDAVDAEYAQQYADVSKLVAPEMLAVMGYPAPVGQKATGRGGKQGRRAGTRR